MQHLLDNVRLADIRLFHLSVVAADHTVDRCRDHLCEAGSAHARIAHMDLGAPAPGPNGEEGDEEGAIVSVEAGHLCAEMLIEEVGA